MKRFFKALIILLLIFALGYVFLFVDISPDVNSFQTSYMGTPTTFLQDQKAHLSNSSDNIFWFVHVTDTHIGAYRLTGDNRQNFQDFLQNMEYINPEFIIDTGDLTNGKIPLPVEQDVEEWRDRFNMLASAEMINISYYYDLPGNHDGYGDSSTFSYFLNWSVQKRYYYNWNRTFSFGNYTFIGLNSAQSAGFRWPDGTNGELNQTELDWFEAQLIASLPSNMTFAFAHHPENDVGNYRTSVTNKTFLELLEYYNVSAYIFGHGHENIERNQGGTICIETDSLGQSFNENGYRIFAIDNDGISCKFQPINTWPAVLITCPLDRKLTMQAFDIPNDSKVVPIRALVFDKNPIISVQYKIDNGDWVLMNFTGNPNLWNASFDASGLSNTEHELIIRAQSSSGTETDAITFRVGQYDTPEEINGPLPDFTRVKNCGNWTLDLSMYEWDRLDSPTQLNWSVSGVNPTLCLVQITDMTNDIVTFAPIKDAVGTFDVQFNLTNSRGKTISGYITIILVARNDPNTFQLYLGIILVIGIISAVSINFLLLKRSQNPLNGVK